MYPMLLLPWWLGGVLDSDRGNRLQKDIAYSTVSGYYFIRLLDNLMDHEDTTEIKILPVVALFHSEFQRVYHCYFDVSHPFWPEFDRHWYGSVEAATVDAVLEDVDRDRFNSIAAAKTCAAKIPVTAVALFYNRGDLVEPWCGLCDELGRFQQMFDDVSDWQVDQIRNDRATFFLCEGWRCKRQDESLLEWVVREGFDWAAAELGTHMSAIETRARDLKSDDMGSYVAERRRMLTTWTSEIRRGFDELSSVHSILRSV
jgi:hypothetical protein